MPLGGGAGGHCPPICTQGQARAERRWLAPHGFRAWSPLARLCSVTSSSTSVGVAMSFVLALGGVVTPSWAGFGRRRFRSLKNRTPGRIQRPVVLVAFWFRRGGRLVRVTRSVYETVWLDHVLNVKVAARADAVLTARRATERHYGNDGAELSTCFGSAGALRPVRPKVFPHHPFPSLYASRYIPDLPHRSLENRQRGVSRVWHL